MRRLAVSASPSGLHTGNHGENVTSQPRASFLIHSFPQAQALTPDHRPKVPLHHNRASLRPFLRPPLSTRQHSQPSERNVGLNDRRRSVSISSRLIHMLLSSRPTGSSAPAVTNGSGCGATLATVLSHGKPIARAVSLRKGRPSSISVTLLTY